MRNILEPRGVLRLCLIVLVLLATRAHASYAQSEFLDDNVRSNGLGNAFGLTQDGEVEQQVDSEYAAEDADGEEDTDQNPFADDESGLLGGEARAGKAAPPRPSAKRKAAEQNFDALMSKNAAVQQAVSAFGNDMNAPVLNALGAMGTLTPPTAEEAKAEIPTTRFDALRTAIADDVDKRGRLQAPLVVLGAARFRGEARQGALALRLELDVTLGAVDQWKLVPVIGDSVVVVSATSQGAALPLSAQDGYHVWVTRESGERTLVVDVLVPARGPRGSIEYDFLVARTPATEFTCRFPVPGLQPKLDAAVRADSRTEGASTVLVASLQPTARIHLVGFRDLGEAETRQAKLYAESLNLLSVDEGALDLFTVIRYSILYAGARSFPIRIPEGWNVVGADGEGAFRYDLDESDGKTVLRGETAFPIRNSYEISLRLHREIARQGETVEIQRPTAQGVEREHGWLAVEVTGKLRLEEAQAAAVLPVDVRQLPPEMLESAVSPILRAYRYHGPDARVALKIERLPEKEPASASVDSVRALSVLSDEGVLLTELRITLRNRLRHSLALKLAEGVQVRSTLLDGQPVKPSRDASGALQLPLQRSEGGEQLKPFTLQVVLEQATPGLGLWGWPEIELPAIELPVSTLAWSLYAPAKNRYSRLRGDVEPQLYAGTARWHQPGYQAPAPASTETLATTTLDAENAAAGGAMPVRIQIPKTGVRLEHTRYWLEAQHRTRVSFSYLRGWLRTPIVLLLLALLIFATALLVDGLWPGSRRWHTPRGATAVATLVVSWPLFLAGGGPPLVLGLLLGAAVALWLRGSLSQQAQAFGDWWRQLPGAWRDARATETGGATMLRTLWRLVVLGFLLLVGLGLLVNGLQLVWVLFNPF
ncbi:MAG: hypothetical protein ABIJ09_04630 [Pseudomonadota bacterium]